VAVFPLVHRAHACICVAFSRDGVRWSAPRPLRLDYMPTPRRTWAIGSRARRPCRTSLAPRSRYRRQGAAGS
jgi:hypothetical protein